MNIKYIIISLTLILFTVSCGKVTDLDLLDNPNGLPATQAKVPLLLNSTQSNLESILNGRINTYAMRFVRMEYQFDNYQISPEYLNTPWKTFYAGLKADNKVLIPLALENGYENHAGIAQIIEAYATIVMVDFWGDIVFSEANEDGIVNPKRDNAKDIYDAIYLLIDEAIINLSNEDAYDVEHDLYYGGDMSKWIKLANTLKIKMFLQTKLVNEAESASGINSILQSANGYISSPVDDFQFTYGTASSSPDTRHPKYSGNYNSAGVGNYASNYSMNELYINDDPRLRYYYFRQTLSDPTGSLLSCDPNDTDPNIICLVGDGYWGRDHCSGAPEPSDGGKRTTWGLYPAGGEFDKDTPSTTDADNGAGGAGIHPIMLSSFVNFMLAEASLTIPGVNGNTANYLETALSESISKVMSFGSLPGADLGSFEPTNIEVTNFIAGVMNDYNAASNDTERLEIIMKQYWLALRGNGLEAYNNYRRTGLPTMQHPISVGNIFPRVNVYPSNHVNTNENATQQSVTNKVFWDTNADGFID